MPSKFFTKPYFCRNPAGKSKVPSWKIFISQLENYFFPVGKSKFRSRAKQGGFLGLFLNYIKRFLFILKPIYSLWTKVIIFDIERRTMSGELRVLDQTQVLNWLLQNELIITSSAKCHPELVSGSHCEPLLTPDCGQMLKQVQHDHLLEVFAFCYIEVLPKVSMMN